MTDPQINLSTALDGRYSLERELGRGGMATVYLARELKHDRFVALKVMHPALAATIGPDRFLREIRTTARLQHPHILPILDSGESTGLLWYTMPYVRGESLRERLSRDVQLPVEDAIELTRQVALALDHAHRQGVIHRDLKPENILLSEGQALVADFGVAKALGSGDAQLTETGLALGTPAYMSPEQAAGADVDARSDVYALGSVLYEMLAGEPPFTGPTPQAVLAKRMLEPVPHVRTVRDSVPEPVEQVLMRALARTPADRFQSASELAQALSGWAHTQTATAAPPARLHLTPAKTVRGGSRRLIALGTALVLTLGVSAALLWRSRAAAAPLDADLVAVTPFDVLSPGLQLWREGMADVLARSLDGAGPLRTVSPTVIIRRWQGRSDRATAATLARSTGAGLTVYGALLPAGRDSVRLTATLFDLTKDEPVAEVEARGPAEHVDQLADSLTIRLLNGLGRRRPLGAVRSGGLGSRSLPALRAFLRGEQHFRRTEWDSARVSYERAVELDTAFAVAYWRLGMVRGWQYTGDDSLSHAYFLRAGELNHGLAPRESLLVLCDSLKSALPSFSIPDSTEEADIRRLFRTAEQATSRYPTDPEAWVALGEVREHFGHGRGITKEMTREAFDRAVALDPDYAPAYDHAVGLAVTLEDWTAAQSAAARFLALRPGTQFRAAKSAEKLLLDPHAPRETVQRLLDSLPANAVFDVYYDFALSPDSAETAIRLWRLFTMKPGSEELYSVPLQHVISVLILTYRGHVREASSLAKSNAPLTRWPEFADLALAGAVPPGTADTIFRRSLHKQPLAIGDLEYAPPWWAARRDSASLKLYIKKVGDRVLASLGPDDPPQHLVRYHFLAAEAYLSLLRGDTASAVSQLQALPTSGPVWFERLTLARLLRAIGRNQEALAVLDRGFPYPFPTLAWAPWALERARVSEQIGEFEKARYWYGYVTRVWRHADPELQPMVAEAQEALSRLTAELH